MKMTKKGFTLIELLAVIVILAILMLLAVPAVLKIMENSKKSSFANQALSIKKAAETQWASDATEGNQKASYATGTLDLSGGTKDLKYSIAINTDGAVTSVCVTDTKQGVKKTTDVSDITKTDVVTTVTACP